MADTQTKNKYAEKSRELTPEIIAHKLIEISKFLVNFGDNVVVDTPYGRILDCSWILPYTHDKLSYRTLCPNSASDVLKNSHCIILNDEWLDYTWDEYGYAVPIQYKSDNLAKFLCKTFNQFTLCKDKRIREIEGFK